MDTLYLSEITGQQVPVTEELALNRRIFHSITNGLCIVDATRRDMPITYVNPAFETITGYSSAEMIGKNCRVLQGNLRDQPALSAIRDAIRERRQIVSVVKNFRKDGTPFWNELALSPIQNHEGRVTHFVGIQSDVTTRVELEAALLESEKLAAVARLASSIAHEINNPLESVMNLVYLAQRTECSAETQKYLEIADQELQRVKLITSQSLRFYKQSTHPQTMGCKQLLDSMLDFYKSRLYSARVVLLRRERATLDVMCLESEIRQVLHNLISNAIDAMHDSGGRLLIRTRHTTMPAPGIIFTIADTGSGIAPSALLNIYTAFFTTKGIAGTGLGLWISSEIVKRHHGHIRVRSSQRPDHSGTVFQVFLPLEAPSK